jgi:hypothetical protein
MTLIVREYFPRTRFCGFLFLFICLAGWLHSGAQIISVTNLQSLRFGAFSSGNSGGSVTVDPSGDRWATGSVNLLNLGAAFHPSVFEIEAEPGTVVSVTSGANIVLAGSNGGHMTLAISNSSLSSPFITSVAPPLTTVTKIGGTLTIGTPASSPPGNYSGIFYITFNNE